MIVGFNEHGVLDPGNYPMTIQEIRHSIFILGPPEETHWDKNRRSCLLDEFEIRCDQLWSAGINDIYIVGSFVTDTLSPKDLDAYLTCLREVWEKQVEPVLRRIDPEFWNFKSEDRGSGRVKYPMWFDHDIEIFPVYEEFLPENAIDPILVDPRLEWFRTKKYTKIEKGAIKVLKP